MTTPEPGFEQFSGQLQQRFEARLDGGAAVPMVLTECVPEPANAASFSLTFRAPAGTPPEQGNFLVSSPELAEMPIFLVPARQDRDGVDFHAVFNRLQEG